MGGITTKFELNNRVFYIRSSFLKGKYTQEHPYMMAEKVVAYVVRFERHLPTYPKIFLPPACGAPRKFLTIPLGHYLQKSVEMQTYYLTAFSY